MSEKYENDPVKPHPSDRAYHPFNKDLLYVIHISSLCSGQYTWCSQLFFSAFDSLLNYTKIKGIRNDEKHAEVNWKKSFRMIVF